MRRSRGWAAGLLAVGLLVAVATPAALAHLRPSLGSYLLHPAVFLVQSFPYAVASVLLVPTWRWGSDRASVVSAAGILALSLVLYVPILSEPDRWGGDMIGLAFLAMSGGMLAVVVVASGLSALAGWLRRPRLASGCSTDAEP